MNVKNTKKRILAMFMVAGLISAAAFAHGVKLVNAPDGIVVNDVRNKFRNGNGVVNISNHTGKDTSVTVEFLAGNARLGAGFGNIENGKSKDIEVDARYTDGITIQVR